MRYRNFCDNRPRDVVANIAICLINQTNYLLDRPIRRLERDFIKDGGIRERMSRARRRRSNPTPKTNDFPLLRAALPVLYALFPTSTVSSIGRASDS